MVIQEESTGNEVGKPAALDRWLRFHRLLGLALFFGAIFVLVIAFVLVIWRNATEEDIVRTIPLAGIIAAVFGLGLLVQVFYLIDKRSPDPVTRAKVIYSIVFGGGFGLVWAVILLTRRSVADHKQC